MECGGGFGATGWDPGLACSLTPIGLCRAAAAPRRTPGTRGRPAAEPPRGLLSRADGIPRNPTAPRWCWGPFLPHLVVKASPGDSKIHAFIQGMHGERLLCALCRAEGPAGTQPGPTLPGRTGRLTASVPSVSPVPRKTPRTQRLLNKCVWNK